MTRKPDWDALGRLFARPAPEPPSAAKGDTVTYRGEAMPRWLARDLMQERAAIMEFEGGLTRKAAETSARSGLK